MVLARVLDDGTAEWAHTGDSRLYYYGADGRELARTFDHMVVELAVRSGEMSPEDSVNHPDRSLLYNSVGGEPP